MNQATVDRAKADLATYNKANPSNLEAMRKRMGEQSAMPESAMQAAAIQRRLDAGTDLTGGEGMEGERGYTHGGRATAYSVMDADKVGQGGFRSQEQAGPRESPVFSSDADLSKPRYDDPTKAKSGEEIYLTTAYGGLEPGNYTIEIKDEGIKEGSDPGSITGETRTRTYAVAPDGTRTMIKEDNKKASEGWDWWNNPANPLSWFN